ncbi:hypothetical protein [Fulvivirga ligni]|uniref:hypothetical protein n=1 Tax=Fulvivirga ligni TaxID=2904246 RepID=UPI001F483A1C|nr:hypothetical protein [Fulvivirga ligni]UII20718.1 hypothetical protein LVD16_23025 [Fulvivirga ligni]
MIPLKESVIKLDVEQKGAAESNIRSRISKKYNLSMVNTSTWVIFPERLFAGKENEDGTVTVARYRNGIFKLFPKVYSKWIVEERGNQVELKVKHRMSTFTIIGLWFFSIQHLITGLLSESYDISVFIVCTIIFVLGIFLLFRETKINERLLAKIAGERLAE